MKRTAAIITVLAITGSIGLGIIIGRLSGGSDGDTLPTADPRRSISAPAGTVPPTDPATPAATLPATPDVATPKSASTPLAEATLVSDSTPESAATPAADATPAVDATPTDEVPTPSLTPTPSPTSTSNGAPTGERSLGSIQQIPTATPTLVPNPPLLPTVTTPADQPSDDGTSIVIRTT